MTGGLPQGGLLRRTGWGLVLLSLVLAPILGGVPTGEQYGGDVALWALRITVFAGSFLVLLYRGMAVGGWSRATVWALGGWAVWTVVSLLFHSRALTSPVLLFTMLPAAMEPLAVLGLMLSVRNLSADRGARPWLLPGLLLGMGITAAMAVVQSLGNPGGYRATGTFFSPNFTAGFLGVCLPLVAVSCVDARGRTLAAVWAGVAALGTAGLVATGSRSGIVLAVGGTVLSLALLYWRRRDGVRLRRVAVLAVALLVGALITRGAVLQRTAGGAQEHSGAFRSETWKGALSMAASNPVFGTGPGTFASKYGPYAKVAWTGQAHSSYLQVASETGFPALLLWSAALCAALGSASRWLRRTERPAMAAALAGALAVAVVRGFLDSETILLGNLLPLAAVIGLVSGGGTPSARWPWWSLLWGVPLGISFIPLARTPSPGSADPGWPAEPGRLAFRARVLEQQAMESGAAGTDTAALRQASKNALVEAARIEPVPRRFFALARLAELEGDLSAAEQWFRKAVDAEPTALQTLHALATLLERKGDTAGAKAVWERLLATEAGPAGQVRAIPELREMWAVHANAALARDAAGRGASQDARKYWESARDGIREYTTMSPLYQAMELERVPADNPGRQAERVIARRAELRYLLPQMRLAGVETDGLEAALDAMDSEARVWAERTAGASSAP